MKAHVFVAAALATTFVCAAANATKTNFHADMAPDDENIAPDVSEDAYGVGDFTYDDQTKQLCGQISWADLSGPATAVYVFQALRGEPESDGTERLTINVGDGGGAGPVSCNFTLTASYEESLKVGELYVNIDTAKNAKGEVRATLNANLLGPVIDCLPDGGVVISATFPPNAISTDAGPSASSSTPPKDNSGCNASNASHFPLSILAAATALFALMRRQRRRR